MSWWKSPVYSDEGRKLYRLLTNDKNDWVRIGLHQIRHQPSGIVYEQWVCSYRVLVCGHVVTGAFTPDDEHRIVCAGSRLTCEIENAHQTRPVEEARSLLRAALCKEAQ
jgi:hypothetical protein